MRRCPLGRVLPFARMESRSHRSSQLIMILVRIRHVRRVGILPWLLLFLMVAAVGAQDVVYQCPMHPQVRSNLEGFCPICGMRLRAEIPEPVEFPLEITVTPSGVKPGQNAQLEFRVLDPTTSELVEHFQVVHEKLFHLFVVSEDLTFFLHDHPEFSSDGKFRSHLVFPKSGIYRILGDFYPDGATPQLIPQTVIVSGKPQAPPILTRDYSTKQADNMSISLVTDPPQPNPGTKTMMFFHVKPADGIDKYLGAWGHMLAVSDDLIDMIHAHPFLADGGPQMQFNMYFPRALTYRVWVQFQRKGVVNTAWFDIPVQELR